MDKIGYINITISGKKGNIVLNPENFDIRDIIDLLENAENLLFPTDKRDRPTISYKIEEGSVKNILKTTIQYVIGFNALIAQINTQKSIDFLELNTAKAFEAFQDKALKKDYIFDISTSLNETSKIRIDKTTKIFRTEDIWADAEFYFYGKITNAGGKDKANIHIGTDEFGILRVDTPISFLERYDNNILYKKYGIRATGKQHIVTGEIDKSSLVFKELIDYNPKYDEVYLKDLREKARKSWQNIDADKWLREIRGGYDA